MKLSYILFFLCMGLTNCIGQLFTVDGPSNVATFSPPVESGFTKEYRVFNSRGKLHDTHISKGGGRFYILVPGRWTKRKIYGYRVEATYPLELHNEDLVNAEKNYNSRKEIVIRNFSRADRAIIQEFEVRIGAVLAGNLDPDDFDDGLSKFVAGLAAIAGNTVNLIYSIRDLERDFNRSNIQSVEDITVFLAKKYGTEFLAKEVIDQMMNSAGVDNNYTRRATPDVLLLIYAYSDLLGQNHYRLQKSLTDLKKAYDETVNILRERFSNYGKKTFLATEKYVHWIPRPFNFRFDVAWLPLSYGVGLNDRISSANESLRANRSNADGKDGFRNSNWGTFGRLTVTPTYKLFGRNRILLGGGYRVHAYAFDREEIFRFSPDFFSEISNNNDFVLFGPLIFDHIQPFVSASYRIKFKFGFLDLNGYHNWNSGQYNFKETELSEGFQWIDSTVKIGESYRDFTYGATLGFGKKFSFLIDFVTMNTDFQAAENLHFFDSDDNRIELTRTNDFGYRIMIGVSANLQ